MSIIAPSPTRYDYVNAKEGRTPHLPSGLFPISVYSWQKGLESLYLFFPQKTLHAVLMCLAGVDFLRTELVMHGANVDPASFGITDGGNKPAIAKVTGTRELTLPQKAANWLYLNPFKMIGGWAEAPGGRDGAGGKERLLYRTCEIQTGPALTVF